MGSMWPPLFCEIQITAVVSSACYVTQERDEKLTTDKILKKVKKESKLKEFKE